MYRSVMTQVSVNHMAVMEGMKRKTKPGQNELMMSQIPKGINSLSVQRLTSLGYRSGQALHVYICLESE